MTGRPRGIIGALAPLPLTPPGHAARGISLSDHASIEEFDTLLPANFLLNGLFQAG